MVVYSIADRRSFLCVSKWMEQIHRLAPPNVQIVLVGNKTDLEDSREVETSEGELKRNRNGKGIQGTVL